jgi:hypothetical protein
MKKIKFATASIITSSFPHITLTLFLIISASIMCCKSPSGPCIPRAEPVILIDPDWFDRDDWPQGEYSVLNAAVDGDILTLQVQYQGGYPHEFDLVAYNLVESEPMQCYLFLAHKEEYCVFERTDELKFNLTPLKNHCNWVYHQTSGMLILKILDRGILHASLAYSWGQWPSIGVAGAVKS